MVSGGVSKVALPLSAWKDVDLTSQASIIPNTHVAAQGALMSRYWDQPTGDGVDTAGSSKSLSYFVEDSCCDCEGRPSGSNSASSKATSRGRTQLTKAENAYMKTFLITL